METDETEEIELLDAPYRLTLEQRAFILEHYFRTNSYQSVINEFKKAFQRREPPNKSTIKQIVYRFREHYIVADVPGSGRPRTLSTADRKQIQDRVIEEPGISARRVSQEIRFAHETVCRGLKEMGYHSYRISMLQEVQPPDYQKRVEFCDWFIDQFGNSVEKILPSVFFSDEAEFNLSGYINLQNFRI